MILQGQCEIRVRQIHLLQLCYVNTDLHLSYVLIYVSERAHVSERQRVRFV